MKKFILLLLAIAVGLTAGCKSNRLVFVTQSSVGLDVSGTAQLPNRISFSFDRYEAAIVPRKTNGEAHSVFGGMDADMTWFSGHAIKQTFATGKAAMLATGTAPTPPSPATTNNDIAPLIFLTATTYGLNLSVGEQSMPPNLLLGYRRTEAAIIPVPDPSQEVRSVYADINISTTTNANDVTTNFSKLRGVRIKQSFATGRAADSLAAKDPEVQQNLQKAAGLSASAQLTGLRAEGKSLADEVADLIDKLSPDKLNAAGQAAVDAKLVVSLDDFNSLTAEKKAEKLKTLVQDRRSSRDIEKVKQFKARLQTLQSE